MPVSPPAAGGRDDESPRVGSTMSNNLGKSIAGRPGRSPLPTAPFPNVPRIFFRRAAARAAESTARQPPGGHPHAAWKRPKVQKVASPRRQPQRTPLDRLCGTSLAARSRRRDRAAGASAKGTAAPTATVVQRCCQSRARFWPLPRAVRRPCSGRLQRQSGCTHGGFWDFIIRPRPLCMCCVIAPPFPLMRLPLPTAPSRPVPSPAPCSPVLCCCHYLSHQ
jgi:hypothetical protein